MKPLFQSFYCPMDCDRKKPVKVDDGWEITAAEWADLWDEETAPIHCGRSMSRLGKSWVCWVCNHWQVPKP